MCKAAQAFVDVHWIRLNAPVTRVNDRWSDDHVGKVGLSVKSISRSDSQPHQTRSVAYPELVSRGVSKTRKFKWLVKVGASIYQTPDLKKILAGGVSGQPKTPPVYATGDQQFDLPAIYSKLLPFPRDRQTSDHSPISLTKWAWAFTKACASNQEERTLWKVS